MASNQSGDYPGTSFPENINDWTAAQRAEVGQALGVYGNPKITAGLQVLATDPPAGEVTKADLAEEKNPPSTAPPGPAPESAYEQLANAQADQYLGMTKSLDNLTSGADEKSIDSNITSGAEAMLGQSSTSPMSQWLNQQSSAAQAQFAPTQAASAQLSSAEDQGSKLVAGALQGMGTAETAMMQAAPYQQLLQSLASEVPYHLANNYAPFPALEGKNVPSWLQTVEKNVGVNTTGQGTGVGVPMLGSPQTAAQGTIAPSSSTNPTPTTYP